MIKFYDGAYSITHSNPDYVILYYPLVPTIVIHNYDDSITLRSHKDFDQFISDLKSIEKLLLEKEHKEAK